MCLPPSGKITLNTKQVHTIEQQGGGGRETKTNVYEQKVNPKQNNRPGMYDTK